MAPNRCQNPSCKNPQSLYKGVSPFSGIEMCTACYMAERRWHQNPAKEHDIAGRRSFYRKCSNDLYKMVNDKTGVDYLTPEMASALSELSEIFYSGNLRGITVSVTRASDVTDTAPMPSTAAPAIPPEPNGIGNTQESVTDTAPAAETITVDTCEHGKGNTSPVTVTIPPVPAIEPMWQEEKARDLTEPPDVALRPESPDAEDDGVRNVTQEPSTNVTAPTPVEPRTKEAVIEMRCDDPTATLVSAYDANDWDATDEHPPSIYEVDTDCDPNATDAEITASERNATLQVLGWLWQHGYKSARWDTRCDAGDGRPDWATKNVYEWGETEPNDDDEPTASTHVSDAPTSGKQETIQLPVTYHHSEPVKVRLEVTDGVHLRNITQRPEPEVKPGPTATASTPALTGDALTKIKTYLGTNEDRTVQEIASATGISVNYVREVLHLYKCFNRRNGQVRNAKWYVS
jgi:hypothetical protein